MARRRSRRRKNSYREEVESTGFPPELVVEDLSPRARRLVEGGVIDLSMINGSGDGGRITSGDILHAARVMEMEQSVARIEAVGRDEARAAEPVELEDSAASATVAPDTADISAEPESQSEPETDQQQPEQLIDGLPPDVESASENAISAIEESVIEITDGTATATTEVSDGSVEVSPDPWNAYNGVSEGLAESALPGAEQSWGEAEANIAAIAEEAAAQVYGRPPTSIEPSDVTESEIAPEPEADGAAEPKPAEPEAVEPESVEPESVEPELADHTSAVVAALSDIEAAVDPAPSPVEGVSAEEASVEEDVAEIAEPAAEIRPVPEPEPEPEPEPVAEPVSDLEPVSDHEEEPVDQQEAMMDFGTLEMVDPESVWAEGAEDFAPWFLAHSRQLGDALGLDAGLSDARQFTTKSATGVVGRDDNGEDVVVVSSQNAIADDSDLGRALGMAASSGAATVALVTAKFNDEQLQALDWLNSQTKSGVQWYGIEMRVFRIADSPAAMLFDLVASPPNPPAEA